MSSIRCPNCKKSISSESKFCSFCGAPMVPAPVFQLLEMTCTRCGAPVQYGNSVETARCNFCGNEMYVNDSVSAYNRTLKAETAAVDRLTDSKIRYENAKTENRKKLTLLELLQDKQSSDVIIVIGVLAFFALILIFGMLRSCLT